MERQALTAKTQEVESNLNAVLAPHRRNADESRGRKRRLHGTARSLAHNGNFAQATEQAGKAKQLDPDIKFPEPLKKLAHRNLGQLQDLVVSEGWDGAIIGPTEACSACCRVLGAPGLRSGVAT